MPLPVVLGIAAGVAALGGVGSGIRGAVKMKDAKETTELARRIQDRAIKKFDDNNKATLVVMDDLGKSELEVLSSFESFANLIEKIQNRPEFKEINHDGISLPKYQAQDLKKVSVGAGVLLGGLGGAAAGTAGGFAAAGATTSAVMALGTASTGTAIASLGGAAATNATLAALGGGALAAGGGGIALGTTMLGVSTLGVGLLVGGVIFNITGSSLSDKADEAYRQAKNTESEVDKICEYLAKLASVSKDFRDALESVKKVYNAHLKKLDYMVDVMDRVDWNEYSPKEKLLVKNCVLLVSVLYNMCKVQLVKKEGEENIVNVKEAKDMQFTAEKVVSDLIESNGTISKNNRADNVFLKDEDIVKNQRGIYECLSCGKRTDHRVLVCPWCKGGSIKVIAEYGV